MMLDKIPKVFFNTWLWVAIAIALIAIHYFFGKPPPPRKPSEFFLRHKKTIRQIYDGFLILMLILNWIMVFYFSTSPALGWPKDIPPTPDITRFPLKLFLSMAISDWGWSAFIIGMLSVFCSNLTRFKRLLLLVISILPIPLVILSLLVIPPGNPEELRITLTAGLYSLIICWLINGPAIIARKHFFYVAWYISRALRINSGEYPDWW
jgi:hypothetical protein